jgi:hypothetical protein
MSVKQYRQWAVVAALVAALSTFAPALAQGPAGSSPNDALTPTGNTMALKAGQQHWYVFHTDGLRANDTPSNVMVQLQANPQGSATFYVWTPAELSQMRYQNPSNPVKPVGQGTVNSYQQNGQTVDRFGGALVWAENARIGNTYYVEVTTTGNQDSSYTLSVTGDAISYPTQMAQTSPRTLPVTGNTAAPSTAQNQSQSAANTSSQANSPSGTGPNNALTTFGQSRTLQPGQQQWFTFQLGGNSSSTAHPTVQVQLSANPQGAAGFAIWTPQRLHDYNLTAGSSNPVQPVGRGTQVTSIDSNGNTVTQYNGDLFWKGDARTGGTFYVVVQNTSQNPVQYTLTLSQQGS